MATYDVTRENGCTVVKKRHPFLGFFVVVFALALIIGGIEANAWALLLWLGVLFVFIVVGRASNRL